jgi:hypothetical protein
VSRVLSRHFFCLDVFVSSGTARITSVGLLPLVRWAVVTL